MMGKNNYLFPCVKFDTQKQKGIAKEETRHSVLYLTRLFSIACVSALTRSQPIGQRLIDPYAPCVSQSSGHW